MVDQMTSILVLWFRRTCIFLKTQTDAKQLWILFRLSVLHKTLLSVKAPGKYPADSAGPELGFPMCTGTV